MACRNPIMLQQNFRIFSATWISSPFSLETGQTEIADKKKQEHFFGALTNDQCPKKNVLAFLRL